MIIFILQSSWRQIIKGVRQYFYMIAINYQKKKHLTKKSHKVLSFLGVDSFDLLFYLPILSLIFEQQPYWLLIFEPRHNEQGLYALNASILDIPFVLRIYLADRRPIYKNLVISCHFSSACLTHFCMIIRKDKKKRPRPMV